MSLARLSLDTETAEKNIPFIATTCDTKLETRLWDIKNKWRDFQELKYLCASKDVIKTFHAATYDIYALSLVGIFVKGPIDCTLIAASLLNENFAPRKLKTMAKRYLDEPCLEDAELRKIKSKYRREAKKGGYQFYYDQIPANILYPYAKQDAVYTIKLWYYFEEELKKYTELYNIEKQLVPIIVKMQQRGFKVDRDYLKQACIKGRAVKISLDNKLRDYIRANTDYDEDVIKTTKFNSTKQLVKIFKDLCVPLKDLTKSGKSLSTGSKALKKVQDHPFVDLIIKDRDVGKSLSTYWEPLYGRYTTDKKPYAHFLFWQCIGGESKVYTKEYGFIKISDLYNFVKETNGDVTIWDGSNYVKAYCVLSGLKNGYRVTFHGGNEIICSKEHKFLVIDERGFESWKTIDEIDNFNDRFCLSEKVDQLSSNEVKREFKNCSSIFNLSEYQIGIILGRLYSDGHIRFHARTGELSWYVAEHEINIYAELSQYITSIGKLCCYSRKYPSKKSVEVIQIHNKELTKILIQYKGKLPAFIFNNKEILRGYLKGFFDGDGCISNNQISVSFGEKVEKKFIQDIQQALYFFGIKSRIFYKQKSNGFTKLSSYLYIQKRSRDLFMKEIGFLNKNKTSKYVFNLPNKINKFERRSNSLSIKKIDKIINCEMYDIVNSESKQFMTNGLIVHNSGAKSGRFSAELIQTAPKRKPKVETKFFVRNAFIPRNGYRFIFLDYSQVEYRLFAHYSNNKKLIKSIIEGLDVHLATAYDLFGKDIVEQSKETKKKYRDMAKTINFGIIYGMGPDKLAASLGIQLIDAYKVLENYFKTYPVKEYMQQEMESLYKTGVVHVDINSELMKFERDYRVPLNYAYRATNIRIQGISAYVMKLAMMRTTRWIKENKIDGHLVVTIHDELGFEIPKKEDKMWVAQNLKEQMEDLITFNVPLTVEVKASDKSWGEAQVIEV